jgi:hypothetical protein
MKEECSICLNTHRLLIFSLCLNIRSKWRESHKKIFIQKENILLFLYLMQNK